MSKQLKVGIIGLGGMGRTHYNCYQNNPDATVAAICDIDPRKRAGDWSTTGLNIDTGGSGVVDLSGVRVYENAADIIADAELDLIDICLPTPMHAPWTMAALGAGKHVLCEKPMAMDAAECEAVRAAQAESGKQLLIGHCLRFWPHYVKAHEIISSGEYGKPLYARLQRSGDTPIWSWDDWLRDGDRSGGAVFDMHIHDVDTALWWFGKPTEIVASGITRNNLPLVVDAQWRYAEGPLVSLYGAWDNNGGEFAFSFQVTMEKATVFWDSSKGPDVLLYKDGQSAEVIKVDQEMGYQHEINEFVDCLLTGRQLERITLPGSQLAVEITREEMRQIASRQ